MKANNKIIKTIQDKIPQAIVTDLTIKGNRFEAVATTDHHSYLTTGAINKDHAFVCQIIRLNKRIYHLNGLTLSAIREECDKRLKADKVIRNMHIDSIEFDYYRNYKDGTCESMFYPGESKHEIFINLEKETPKLIEKVIFLHEVGHLVYNNEHLYSKPKLSAKEAKLYYERQAWKYALKHFTGAQKRIAGKIAAASYLTYLLNERKLKNLKYWYNKLEYYQNYCCLSTKRILDQHKYKMWFTFK